MNKTLLCAALAGALSASITVSAQAAEEKVTGEKEKCYGVAKAGKNNCAAADGSHSCAGQSTKDNAPNEWKYVKKGECQAMGGTLTAPKK